MMTSSRVFPTPPPPQLLEYARIASELTDETFGRLLRNMEEIVLGGQILADTGLKELSKSLKIDEGAILGGLRLYSYLIRGFLREPSAKKFQEEVGSIGLVASKAKLLWESFSANKEKVESHVRPLMREQFGPILTGVRWRVDRPFASSEPFADEAVGVISIDLERPEEEYNERFEVNLETLDRLIDELSSMRRALAKLRDGDSE